jgi:hypothetical protein
VSAGGAHPARPNPFAATSDHLGVLSCRQKNTADRWFLSVYYPKAYFDQGLCHCGVLADDRRRLDGLIPCADRQGMR